MKMEKKAKPIGRINDLRQNNESFYLSSRHKEGLSVIATLQLLRRNHGVTSADQRPLYFEIEDVLSKASRQI